MDCWHHITGGRPSPPPPQPAAIVTAQNTRTERVTISKRSFVTRERCTFAVRTSRDNGARLQTCREFKTAEACNNKNNYSVLFCLFCFILYYTLYNSNIFPVYILFYYYFTYYNTHSLTLKRKEI